MFSWIKDRRNRAAEANFIESVPRVLAEYGKLLEKFPAAYIDEAWLPLKKLGMKRALKIGWKLAKDDEQREWIKRLDSFVSVSEGGWKQADRFKYYNTRKSS